MNNNETKKSRRKKRTVFLRLFFLLLIICYPLVLGVMIYETGQRDECTPSDVIIVMGAAQYNGTPSDVLKGRLEFAVALYKDGIAPFLLFTGGKKRGDIETEAQAAKKYAIDKGVPEQNILTENTGLTTIQSMQNALDIMHANNLSSAILVSDPYHMYRLKRIAKDIGMTAVSSPTAFSRYKSSQRNLEFISREIIVYTLYRLTGI